MPHSRSGARESHCLVVQTPSKLAGSSVARFVASAAQALRLLPAMADAASRLIVPGTEAAHTLSCLLGADHRSWNRVPACSFSACALIDALTVWARLPMKRDVLPVCSAEHPEPDQGIAYVDEIVGFCIELRTERVA